MSSYDKMESVQNSLESLSRSVNRPSEGETLTQDKVENDNGVLSAPENVREDMKEESEGTTGADGTDNTDVTGSSDVTDNAGSGDAAENSGSTGTGDGTGTSVIINGTEDAVDAKDTEAPISNMPEASASLGQLGDGDFYIVKKGDTLDTISIDVYGDRDHVDAICKMNGLSNGNLIYIGQKLLLP